jgi:hypothetical protein
LVAKSQRKTTLGSNAESVWASGVSGNRAHDKSATTQIRITEKRKTLFIGTSMLQEIEAGRGHFLYFLQDTTTGYHRYEISRMVTAGIV